MSHDVTGGPVRPGVALTLVTIVYAALVIAGFGMLSLALDVDVIATAGLGLLPGVVAVACAVIAFAGALRPAVIAPHPTYWAAAWSAAAGFLGYLAGLAGAALAGGAGPATALAAAGGFAVSWFALLLAAIGVACGWGGVALVRTRASRPRWPWEDEDD